MRVYLFFLFSCCLLVNAQEPPPTVTLSAKDVALNKVLRLATRKVKYTIHLPGGRNRILDTLVTCYVINQPLPDFLKAMLAPFPLRDSIQGKDIFIVLRPQLSSPADVLTESLPMTLYGEVRDDQGAAVANATIELKGRNQKTTADSAGRFVLSKVRKGEVVIAGSINTGSLEKMVEGPDTLRFRLKQKVNMLAEVVVENGYQRLNKQMNVGSAAVVDNFLFNRNPSSSVLDRIENTVPGVLFTRGGQGADGNTISDLMQIRGRSTLIANAAPLIVLNNFPYDGDLRNINPNDVDTVFVLKDAAATSIWGARAGNGVIIIATKKGKEGVPQVVYNTSIGIQQRPDLFNVRSISPTDFLGFEQFLFDKGYYTPNFTDPQNYAAVTPGVALLYAAQQGQLSPPEAAAQRDALGKTDVRNELSKYLYRNSVNQQHSLQVSGNAHLINYYLSAGWDHNLSSLAATSYDRISLRSQNSLTLTRNLQVDAGINFTKITDRNGGNIQYNYQSPFSYKNLYPYAQLADARGRSLPLNLDYNTSYQQQTSQLGYSSWALFPLDELHAEDNRIVTLDYLLTTGIRYKILSGLNLEFRYQYEDQHVNRSDYHSDGSYFVRNLRNSFIQVDPTTHALTYPIPAGGILDLDHKETVSSQGRLQLNYGYHRGLHDLEAIAGYEIRDLVTTEYTNRDYGYNPDLTGNTPAIDYVGNYTQYLTYQVHTIPHPESTGHLTDHFLSVYGNVSYTHHSRYSLFGSIRKDEANLFGVRTNEKGVPLWSAGTGWQVNKESFYHLLWLPSLKLKATYGTSGNIARLASAYTTAVTFPGGLSGSPYPMLMIQGPPNKELRWEQVRQLNLGVDFETKNRLLTGTIEYYQKHSIDLLAPSETDPTLGIVQTTGIPGTYYGNTASVRGKGVDLQLEARPYTSRHFAWTSTLIGSYSVSKVERYLRPAGVGNLYLNQNAIAPVPGKPVYSVFSYQALPLDPKTGDPRGVFHRQPSTDWDSIYNNTKLDSMAFHGSAQPIFFGVLRNSFAYRHLSLMLSISFKLDYYYRKPSFSASDAAGKWTSSSDYAQSWKQPGDEKRTNVPLVVYPLDPNRDHFYLNSSTLIRRSDNIRWEDVSLNYDLDKQWCPRLPFQHVRIYGIVSNLGVLWKSGKDDFDPYYINVPKDRPRYTIGLTLNFFKSK